MRKLKLQMQISVDGFVSTGPNDDQTWVTWAWEEIRPQVLQLLDSADTILLGRKLAVDYIPHWEGVNKKPNDPMYELAQRIVPAKKVVFTKTIENSFWNNTEIAKENIVVEVNKLKNQNGKDMIVYGGRSFVSSLIKEHLIDEYNLFINPAVLGNGLSIFNSLEKRMNLNLVTSKVFDCGIVLNNYEPAK